MVLRKVDRLEGMLEERAYDVFKDPGDGSDGTMIAEIRDLRRYLLLIESELIARNAIVDTDRQCGPRAGENQDEWARKVPRYNGATEIAASSSALDTELRAGTPEDGGHHARQSENGVLWMERLDDGLAPLDVPDEQRKWYMRVITQNAGTRMIVDRRHAPVGCWMHLPRLRTELNCKEMEETPDEYQPLFEWHENDSKWIMKPEFLDCWAKH